MVQQQQLSTLAFSMKDSAHQQKKLLKKVASLVNQDPSFMGLWTVGSMATGTADKYSDLDLYLLVQGDKYDEIYGQRSSFARKIGKVISTFEVEWPNCQLYGVILDNCVEVDLCYCKPEQIEMFGPYNVIVDKIGNLEELLSKHTLTYETDVKKRLTEHMDFAAYNLLHAINMLGRGEYWSSIRQVEILRKRVVSLIGLRTKTDVEEEYRRLEQLASEETNRSLQETLCHYNFESIAKAISATTALFIQQAQKLCKDENLPFPLGRFERLLKYFSEVCSEQRRKSIC